MGASREITTTARCRKNRPVKSIKCDYIKAGMSFCLGENEVLMPLNLLLKLKNSNFFSIKRITFSFHIRSFNLQLQNLNKLLFITASDKKWQHSSSTLSNYRRRRNNKSRQPCMAKIMLSCYFYDAIAPVFCQIYLDEIYSADEGLLGNHT